MTAIAELEADLNWREAEIGVIKILLSDSTITDREKLVLFRAGWALLYAHYEGFCKLALTIYFDQIKLKNIQVRSLPLSTQIFALSKQLTLMKKLSNERLMSDIASFDTQHISSCPNFPDVETNSNLWPDRLRELINCADITLESLDEHERKLKTLVNRRNNIAHGEKDHIPDYAYFSQFENAVQAIMVELAIKIDDKLAKL